MNREKALEIARELKKCSEEYESITVLEHDTEFFDYVIKELERTVQGVPVNNNGDEVKIKFKIMFKNGQIGYFISEDKVTIETVELLSTTIRKVMEKGLKGSITMIDTTDNKMTLINLQEIATIGYSLAD